MSPESEYDAVEAGAVAEAYDAEAQATEYPGAEIAFGMAQEYVLPGQSLLDLGIGTGLASVPFRTAGLRVYGMDLSQEMLDACRWKGYADLTLHDLLGLPYPYTSESFDHALCMGVLPFLSDLSPVFAETARLLRTGGIFVFLTSDRKEEENPELVIAPEFTGIGESVTLYRHSHGQVSRWLDEFGFTLLGSLPVALYMDREKKETMPAVCYAARKAARGANDS